MGGNVQDGSRGGANPNEFGRDATECGQLIYDPPPAYPLSARTPLQSLHGSENGEDVSACTLPQESAALHGMLHASRQWLGEISQSSAMSSRVFPQIPFSETYIENATMQDYDSEEVDAQMDEDTPRMRGQGRACIIQRRNGFVTPASWSILCRPYLKCSWKPADKRRYT